MSKKAEKIGREIIQKTGIDFDKYRRPELISTIVDVSLFIINPLSVIPIFVKAFIYVFLFINTILLIMAKAGHISLMVAVLMFIIGNVGFPFISTSLAIRRTGHKLIGDIQSALNIALDIAVDIIKDLKKMNLKQIPPVTDIIRGVVFVVIIPSLEKIISEKIKLLGKPVAWLVEKSMFSFITVFSSLIDKLTPGKQDVEKLDQAFKEDVKAIQEMSGDEESKMVAMIETARDKIGTLLIETIMPKILFPFTLALYISTALIYVLLMVVYFFGV